MQQIDKVHTMFTSIYIYYLHMHTSTYVCMYVCTHKEQKSLNQAKKEAAGLRRNDGGFDGLKPQDPTPKL